ncbi:MAG: hypothetical protein ABW221_13915 [Vicinamibacteria bacterium]
MRMALRSAVVISLAVCAGCDGLSGVFAWPADAKAIAPKPIPSGPGAPTTARDRALRLAWGRTHLLDAYAKVGRRSPRWDADAQRLVEKSVESMLGNAVEAPPADRIAAGRAAVAAGCDDPLVLYLLARTLYAADALSAEPEEMFRRSVEGMKAVRYDRAVARLPVTALYSRYESRRESVGLRPPLAALELQWFEESLSDGSYGPDDDIVLTWQLLYGVSNAFVRRSNDAVSAAIDRAPWIDRWVKLHFSGLMHIRRAFKARGQKWAKDVTEEEWKVFRAENALARRDLEESWRLRPDRPEAAVELITVAEDDPREGEDARFWFDRTVAAQMDYLGAYDTVRVRLLPRWGGSHERMFSFGREALETRRFDTEVPAQFLWTVLAVRRDQRSEDAGDPDAAPVLRWPDTMPLMRSMFEGYLAEPARAAERPRWESLWAVVADRAGEAAEAARHLAAAGGRLDPNGASQLEDGETPDAFARRVVLAASPAAAEIARAEARREAFDVEGALAAYRDAQAKDPSPAAAAAIGYAVSALQTERTLAKGGWVPFLPATEGLEGWRPLLGTWTREADGSLVGFAGSLGLMIVADARVGPDFEIRGTMELVSSTNGFFQGGVVFGHPSWDSQDWMAFRIQRTPDEGQVAYFGQHFYGAPGGPFRLPVPDRNAFTVRVHGRKLSATVNGTAIAGQVPEKGLVTTPDLQVGFGGYVDENLVSIRFRDVELRRLGATSSSN